MTDATIALAGMAELADKGPDVDMLRQMVQFMAQRLMDMDVESLCGAGYDEKWPAAGSVDTNLGSLSLLELDRTDVPKRRVSARRVVEPLDVVEHICLDVVPCPVDLARDSLRLH